MTIKPKASTRQVWPTSRQTEQESAMAPASASELKTENRLSTLEAHWETVINGMAEIKDTITKRFDTMQHHIAEIELMKRDLSELKKDVCGVQRELKQLNASPQMSQSLRRMTEDTQAKFWIAIMAVGISVMGAIADHLTGSHVGKLIGG